MKSLKFRDPLNINTVHAKPHYGCSELPETGDMGVKQIFKASTTLHKWAFLVFWLEDVDIFNLSILSCLQLGLLWWGTYPVKRACLIQEKQPRAGHFLTSHLRQTSLPLFAWHPHVEMYTNGHFTEAPKMSIKNYFSLSLITPVSLLKPVSGQ